MRKEYKVLIDKYLNGTATGDDLVLINRLIIEDDEFSKRLELKKAFKAASDLEKEFNYRRQLTALLKRKTAKRFRTARLFVSIAASVAVVAGMFYFLNDSSKEFSTDIDYFEVNYDGGTGFLGNEKKNTPVLIRKINIHFFVNSQQKDTTYLITNTDSLKIMLPKITSNLKQSSISSLYDYKLGISMLLINKDTFEIRKSLRAEKLMKYKR